MKLLIITQKVDINDDNLGFFHRWLEKLSEKLDGLLVVCLSRGEYSLPPNVEVYSMGKEAGASKIVQLIRLQKYLYKNRNEFDGIFVHMAPIYAIASFPIAKLFGKKILMWYVHRSRNWKLWIAEKLVSSIFTASRESFCIKSQKARVTGHGIDTEFFKPGFKDDMSISRVLFVGRTSPIKDLKTLVCAADTLINAFGIRSMSFDIVGAPVTLDESRYLKQIESFVAEKNISSYIKFSGGMPQNEVLLKYQASDLLVNLCPSGGLDKAVLEAMACGLPVIVCNEGFRYLFSDRSAGLMFMEGDHKDLARRIRDIMGMDDRERNILSAKLRDSVVLHHNLDNLMGVIVNYFDSQ